MLISRCSAPTKRTSCKIIDGVVMNDVCYTGVKREELIYDDDDYQQERELVLRNNSKDGVMPMTKKELDLEREASFELVKKFTMNLFRMDFTNFSFPCIYSENRSFLERTADLFTFLANTYIEKAKNAIKDVDKLVFIAIGITAGFHLYIKSKKPWNPVLGETYVGRWQNGTTIYGEQTSHHPPYSYFQIYGPNNSWKCNANNQFTIDSGIFNVNIIQKGKFKLEFNDGNEYEWEFPNISVSGILKGDRIVKIIGTMKIRDLKNMLECNIKLAPNNGKVKGYPKGHANTLYGTISKVGDKKIIKEITGDFCHEIFVDDKVYWNIEKNIVKRPIEKVNDDELLPSDCRFRLDRSLLIRKKIDLADQAKTEIELLQRHEKKIRK